MARSMNCPLDVWDEEKTQLYNIQSELNGKILENNKIINNEKRELKADKFEEQERWAVAGKAHSTIEKCYRENKEYKNIFDDPYFGRIDISSKEDPHITCYLSKRSEMYTTSNNDCIIFGFGDDSTDLVKMVFERFYGNNVEKFIVNNSEYKITIRRRIQVDDGELVEVAADYPSSGEAKDTTDLFLLKVLESRRGQTGITDIIATIQDKQYTIIKSDVKENIVVQGCAGSGKTQILLQRLFFLRQSHTNIDWDSVMIITPTRLFSFFSHDLYRRFGLSEISQTSLAEYYWDVLNVYDPRFKNRQYDIVLSEENLPDEYLSAVYSTSVIDQVENAIESAIQDNIKKAEIDIVLNKIDGYSQDLSNKEKIELLLKGLNELLIEQKGLEELLKENEQYIENNKQIAEITRKKGIQERRITQTQNEMDKLNKKLESVHNILKDIDDTQNELQHINTRKKSYTDNIKEEILKLITNANSQHISGLKRYELLSEYCSLQQLLQVFNNEIGLKYKGFQQEIDIYNGILEEDKFKLKELFDTDNIDKIKESISKRKNELEQRLLEVEQNISNLNNQFEVANESNRSISVEALDNSNILDSELIKELEAVRYYLSRIETSVFEQEVWSVMAPYKQKYGVKDISISESSDGSSKHRVLYKSDLMFYLRIYIKLYGIEKIEQKSLICIDEAQDLNHADYRILSELQPNTAVNIYGDTSQTLYENCGIQEWGSLPFCNCKVHLLNENYRNTPEIVEFSNNRFHTSMKAFGIPGDNIKLVDWNSISGIKPWLQKNTDKVAVIVKDIENYYKLVKALSMGQDKFCYLSADASTPKESAINVYSIYAAKGLEFPMALVIADGMNENQKYVAVTRAMKQLVYCE